MNCFLQNFAQTNITFLIHIVLNNKKKKKKKKKREKKKTKIKAQTHIPTTPKPITQQPSPLKLSNLPPPKKKEQSSKIAKKCKTIDTKIGKVHYENKGGQNMENIIGLDHNVINSDEGNDQNVNKNTGQTDEPENIRINEAQT
ncbi:hypothetical protein DVH24_009668 [Malus domestica]|uniref:Uncharacterized protein n=1 Tax=Malus domestica TaxID=3750 RepID=A0A498JP54_MALDO|nr:hypothetical protein DVH24_009668 [Malus domestica]